MGPKTVKFENAANRSKNSMVLDLPEPTLRIDKLGARVRKIHARSQTNLQSVHLKSMSQYMHNMDIWILVLLH